MVLNNTSFFHKSSDSVANSSHAYSSDMEESKFLKRSRLIHVLRLILSFLTLGIALAVIACEAQPLQHYKNTSQWAVSGLTLWPLNLDIRPTIAAIACGSIISVFNMAYIIAAFIPCPFSLIRPRNIYASASAIAGLITSIFGTLFMIYLPFSKYPAGYSSNETLESWTCKWRRGTSGTTIPRYFNRNCVNAHAGFVLMCTLIGMEVLMGISAVVGIWLQRSVSRRREQEFEVKKKNIINKYRS